VSARRNNVVSPSGARADRCALTTINHRLAALGVAATADCEDVGCRQAAAVMTHYMNHKTEHLDIPSIPEFIELIADSGAGMYACKASVDLFGLEKNDFIPQVQDIITVGEFHERAAGGQMLLT